MQADQKWVLAKRKTASTAAANTKTEDGVEKETEKARANLVFDKSLSYKIVRKVMHTTALAGYNEFKFIVQTGE